jgi:hypothetical protein
MRGLMMVLMVTCGMVGVMAGCTTTRTETQMMGPPNDQPMGPPNEKAPRPYIKDVTDPTRQMPSNGPSQY